ncbi:MAG: hypothetical protein KAI47_08460, partial [Deltaproteobacteria bacterium]|nr:hypothetical protein [Deltaproteobacteria bacterium]
MVAQPYLPEPGSTYLLPASSRTWVDAVSSRTWVDAVSSRTWVDAVSRDLRYLYLPEPGSTSCRPIFGHAGPDLGQSASLLTRAPEITRFVSGTECAVTKRMTQARPIEKGATYLLTRRCFQRQ